MRDERKKVRERKSDGERANGRREREKVRERKSGGEREREKERGRKREREKERGRLFIAQSFLISAFCPILKSASEPSFYPILILLFSLDRPLKLLDGFCCLHLFNASLESPANTFVDAKFKIFPASCQILKKKKTEISLELTFF